MPASLRDGDLKAAVEALRAEPRILAEPGAIGNQERPEGRWMASSATFSRGYVAEAGVVETHFDGWVGLTVLAGGRSPGRSLGSYVLSPPDAPNRIAVSGGECLLQMRVRPSSFRSLLLEAGGDAGRLVSPIRGERDILLLGHLGRAILGGGEEGAVLLPAIISRLASREVDVTVRLAPAKLRRTCDLLDAQLADLNVAAMADHVSLSTFHFARGFRHEFGVSPWHYVIHRRVWRGVLLLCTTELPVVEIARVVGFVDGSHMARCLRQQFGLNPAEVRCRLKRQETNGEVAMVRPISAV